MEDTPVREMVERYLTVPTPEEELLRDLVARRDEAVPLLVEEIRGAGPVDPDDPRAPRELRAAWILVHLRAPEALPAFEAVLGDHRRLHIALQWFDDLAVYGPALLPVLERTLGAETADDLVVRSAAELVSLLGRTYPEIRSESIGILRRELGERVPTKGCFSCAEMAAACAVGLAELGDEESIERIRGYLAEREFAPARGESAAVREAIRGWRTVSSQPIDPPEFDIFELREDLAWTEDRERASPWGELGVEEEEPAPEPIRREMPKVGRNAPCPCGSGRKFKKCCGAP